MENLVSTVTPEFWQQRRVLISGHTGFKGSWLALWLAGLGAEVHGYALPPPTTPSLFEVASIGQRMQSTLGDIRDAARLDAALQAAQPEIIFHLAAQPLVGEGYRDPVATYATNVMGTVNLLESARRLPALQAIVAITTDKCYANPETGRPFREDDPLGGADPYSSSKACTELVCAAYRQSFLAARGIQLATARAGNVIGGGDWAAHRLVPDLLRELAADRPACLRNPHAVRPWQHVLEPLSGYLRLAEILSQEADGVNFTRAWNFGPEPEDCVTTGQLADILTEIWQAASTMPARWQHLASDFPHEAGLLSLDASAAKQALKWRPKWPLKEAIHHTVDWHRAWLSGEDMQAYCLMQIASYTEQK